MWPIRTAAGHLGTAIWVPSFWRSPFGRWDVWALRTFGRRRFGAMSRHCR